MQKRMKDSDLELFIGCSDETKLQAFRMWHMTKRQEYWHLTARSMWRAVVPSKLLASLMAFISKWI